MKISKMDGRYDWKFLSCCWKEDGCGRRGTRQGEVNGGWWGGIIARGSCVVKKNEKKDGGEVKSRLADFSVTGLDFSLS